MATPTLMPSPRQKFFDNIGLPLVRGYVFTFAAGTTTKLAAFQDAAGTIPHENPIRLDSRGEATIYWLGNYKVDLRDAFGIQVPGYPVDNFKAIDIATSVSDGMASVLANFLSGLGSSLIGFIQAGVGAIARTVQSKLRERVTPEDFDAKGDGLADDTIPIRRAIAAILDEGVVHFAPGKTYRVTDTIDLLSKNLRCDGKAAIMFDMNNSTKDGLVCHAKKLGLGLQEYFPAPRLSGIKFIVHSNMRDALVLNSGEYPEWANIDVNMDFTVSPNPVWRDAVHVETTVNGEWVENLHWRNIRVSGAGRDAFRFEVAANPAWENVFINVGSYYDLECRAAGMSEPGKCVHFVVKNTRATEKISQHNFFGGEFQLTSQATNMNPDAFGTTTVVGHAPIENLNFVGLTMECVPTFGTGAAINVTEMTRVTMMNILPFGFLGSPTNIVGPTENYVNFGYLGLDHNTNLLEWLPTISGGTVAGTPVYNFRGAVATRVGKMVNIAGEIAVSDFGGATGMAIIGNLPWPVLNRTYALFSGELSKENTFTLGPGYTEVTVKTRPTSSTLNLVKSGTNVNSAFVDISEISVPCDLSFSITYNTD